MRWKVYHYDWPEDAVISESFESAKIRALGMDERFRLGRKAAAGFYCDERTGIVIEPIVERQDT